MQVSDTEHKGAPRTSGDTARHGKKIDPAVARWRGLSTCLMSCIGPANSHCNPELIMTGASMPLAQSIAELVYGTQARQLRKTQQNSWTK